jgi:hypothetical protein
MKGIKWNALEAVLLQRKYNKEKGFTAARDDPSVWETHNWI